MGQDRHPGAPANGSSRGHPALVFRSGFVARSYSRWLSASRTRARFRAIHCLCWALPSLIHGRRGSTRSVLVISSLRWLGAELRRFTLTTEMMPGMADMKRPPDLSADEYLTVINDLLRLYETQASIETWPKERRHVLALAGLENAVLEAAYAVLALRRADLHAAAAVHVRKALEFAVVAQWIHVTPNGLDAFLHESKRNVDNLMAEANTANVLVPSDVAATLAPEAVVAPDEAKVMRRFKQVADSFGVGSGIYMMYRSLSGDCHPNVGAIVQHLEEAPESTGGVAIHLHGGKPNSAH